MRKLVILENLNVKYLSQLKNLVPNWEIICSDKSEVYLPHLADAEVLMGWCSKYATRECLKPETSLRWIHCWGAGVNMIPLELLKEYNIKLTNSSGVHGYPISETVFAIMLSLTRKIHTYIRYQIKAEWNQDNNNLELHGKTLGILGMGEIGIEIAKIARAFGMKVLGYRRSMQPISSVDILYPYGKQGLHDLLRCSDYIVNSLPLTSKTCKLIGSKEFSIMKPTAFYINVGRGETTDTDAMIQALKEGGIAGAGLDVFEQEPLPSDNPLWSLENVILTPHTSGLTMHYTERVMDIFIQDFKDYLNGRLPSINRVNLDLGY